MYDQSCSSYFPWDPYFFHHYLRQHARLTNWMLNLHPNHACHHDHHQNHVCCHNQHQRRPYIRCRNSRKNSRRESHHRSDNGNEYNAASDSENDAQEEDNENDVQEEDNENDVQEEDNENDVLEEDNENDVQEEDNENDVQEDDSENDVSEEQNEDDDLDGEWVFNAEPFLAFRAANKAKNKNSEEKEDARSIELVDAVLDENFEFIQLDDFGRMQKVLDRPSTIDAWDDREYDKAARTVIYGDRADRIAGLETSLEIMFDHINDLHEPIIYPIV